MLTDAALKCLKPKAKMYKLTDRDGMYVRVAPTGGISFRLDYRLNGRRETVHLGRYARDGISLARARELCLDAKRMIAEGRSPAIEKQREKRRIKEAKSFGEFGEKWLAGAPMADSTRAMRRAIFERELIPSTIDVHPAHGETSCIGVKHRVFPGFRCPNKCADRQGTSDLALASIMGCRPRIQVALVIRNDDRDTFIEPGGDGSAQELQHADSTMQFHM